MLNACLAIGRPMTSSRASPADEVTGRGGPVGGVNDHERRAGLVHPVRERHEDPVAGRFASPERPTIRSKLAPWSRTRVRVQWTK